MKQEYEELLLRSLTNHLSQGHGELYSKQQAFIYSLINLIHLLVYSDFVILRVFELSNLRGEM